MSDILVSSQTDATFKTLTVAGLPKVTVEDDILFTLVCPTCNGVLEAVPYVDDTGKMVEGIDSLRESFLKHLEAEHPVTAPAEALPKPKAKAKKVKPCVCGATFQSGKEASAHKATCDQWNHRNDVTVDPVVETETHTEPEAEVATKATPVQESPAPEESPTTDPWFVLGQLNDLLASVESRQMKAAKFYQEVAKKEAQLQLAENSLPRLKKAAEMGVISTEEYRLIERNRDLAKAEVEAKAKTADYVIGKSVADIYAEQEEIKRVATENNMLDSAGASLVQKAIDEWKALETARFEDLLGGAILVPTKDEKRPHLSFLEDAVWYANVCVKKATVTEKNDEIIRQAIEEAVADRIARVRFESTKTFVVKAPGYVANKKDKLVKREDKEFVGVGELPLQDWQTKVVKMVTRLRREFNAYRASHEGKMPRFEDLLTEKGFAKNFDYTLREVKQRYEDSDLKYTGKGHRGPKTAMGIALQAALDHSATKGDPTTPQPPRK